MSIDERQDRMNEASPKVRFLNHDCDVEKRHYDNGRPALVLNDARDGEMFAVATVNLPDVPAGPNEVFIKDYSENKGMLQSLTDAGIVRPTGLSVTSGFVEIPVCELQPPFREPERPDGKEGYDPTEFVRGGQVQDKDKGRTR